jgi:cytochrome c
MQSRAKRVLTLAAAAAFAAAGCATPQPVGVSAPARPSDGYGKAISDSDLASWNIDIRAPDGRGLPAGRGTVAEGKNLYEAKCLACHGADAKGGSVYGTMVGGVGSFVKGPRVLTPGSMYPYAPILFDYIRRAMPMDSPQSLSVNEVYAVSAYLLHLNGLIPADAVMDASAMPRVMMPNRDGFIVDDRPDTNAVRCMTNCK